MFFTAFYIILSVKIFVMGPVFLLLLAVLVFRPVLLPSQQDALARG
jgi:hypothetical protein